MKTEQLDRIEGMLTDVLAILSAPQTNAIAPDGGDGSPIPPPPPPPEQLHCHRQLECGRKFVVDLIFLSGNHQPTHKGDSK